MLNISSNMNHPLNNRSARDLHFSPFRHSHEHDHKNKRQEDKEPNVAHHHRQSSRSLQKKVEGQETTILPTKVTLKDQKKNQQNQNHKVGEENNNPAAKAKKKLQTLQNKKSN